MFTAHLAAGGFPLLTQDDNIVEGSDVDTEDNHNHNHNHVVHLFDPPELDQHFLQDDHQQLMDISRQPHDTMPLLGMCKLDVIHQWPSSWHGWHFDNLMTWLVDMKGSIELQPVAFVPILSSSLSHKQFATFDLIRSHTFGTLQDEQLLMIVLGTTGTGKSYLIDAIRTLFVDHNSSKCMKITAPMGIAAANITGLTIYSLLSISNLNLSG